MQDWLIVLILGIVEGITEFLPISSTGHLLIAEKIIGSHQSDLFNVVIQAGAVIAVIPLFRERFHKFLFEPNKPETKDYLTKLVVAFLITCAGGLVITKKHISLPEELTPVAIALLVGGIIFLVVEYLLKGKTMTTEVTWKVAIAVGLGQLIAAVFPGASRSGTTIMLSLLLGLSRPAATEFSFLVSIPTMLAASASKFLPILKHPELARQENWTLVALATVVSAVVSFVAVKWLLRYVQSHTFNAFGWYRIILAVVIFAVMLRGGH